MIVDSSAIVAIVTDEDDADSLLSVLRTSNESRMSSANYLEVSIVLDSHRNPQVSRRLDELLRTTGVELIPFTADQARIARQAYRDFGKGSGHPAQLNFGDCFAYALAQDTGEPLLFKGDDFARAGVRSARPAQQT